MRYQPLLIVATLAMLLVPGSLFAQPTSRPAASGAPGAPGGERPRAWELTYEATEVSDTDFDGAQGSVTARSTRLGIAHKSRIAAGPGPGRFLTLLADYRFTDFEFDNFQIGGMSLTPFDRVHATSIGASLVGQIEGPWWFFALGSLTAAFEEGGDVDQSIKPLTVGVITYRFSETLTAGIGLGAIYDLDDRLRAFPAISLDWQIADRWSFQIREGAALTYVVDRESDLEVSLRAGFSSQFGGTRFRLADNGPAPEGTAEFEGNTLGIDVNWKPAKRWELGLGVGAVTNYELKIDNDRNDRVFVEDIDPGLQFLLRVGWKF